MYNTETGEMLYSIKEAAKEIDVSPATIRNWEKKGIFISRRSKNRYRVFDSEDMNVLRSLVRYSRENKVSVNAANLIFSQGGQRVKHRGRGGGSPNPCPFKSEKWKNCRLARGFSLEETAKASGISSSYLYKIENERANVSLDILQRLADFYGENLLYFFDEVENERHLIKKGTGEKIDIGITGLTVSSLIGLNKFKIYMMLYEVAPHSGREIEQSHHGEEVVYVLSGKIHFRLDNIEYVLSSGDSFSFHSKNKHSWFNHENREARMIWDYTELPQEN